MLFKKSKNDDEAFQMIKEVSEVRQKLNDTHIMLDYTTDDNLIESMIYEIMSLQKKYDYYIKLCKQKGIRVFNKML